MTESTSIDRAADALDRSTLLALIDASRSINEELDPAEICRRVAAHAASVLQAEGSSVLLHDAEHNELVFHTVIGPESDQVKSKRFPDTKGIAGQVVRTRRAVRLEDVRQNRNFYPGIDLMTKQRTRDLMAAPLIHRDDVLGVVEVINRKSGGMFSDRDLQLLELFANLVAGAARNAQVFERLSSENRGLRESLPVPQFIGQSEPFQEVLRLCRTIGPQNTTVLLMGETGTGKEMAARAICAMSPRAGGPFVAVNCAALPESLIESELFGHEAGAFTGAENRRAGKFELAHRGTLLMDEIGELEPGLQAKLLRVIETREITPVGGSEPVTCDVRIIVATNRDLRAEVEAGRFREDLYYRCSVFPIQLPPLRERAGDIPLLIEHLMAQVVPSLGVEVPDVSDEAMDAMRRYTWPGNVRELRNVVERAVLLADDTIEPAHLPPEVRSGGETMPSGAKATSVLAEHELRLVQEALEHNDWNQSAAARQLGISRDILRSRIRRYGLRPPDSA
jgi:transcriptional regulator with GAF, ATPase, and Fis domain